jgi:hypothetical protein
MATELQLFASTNTKSLFIIIIIVITYSHLLHSVEVVLTLVQTKIIINVHKRNNTKTQYQQ